ncbi:A/G-specific adenine glycosylase [Polynucleobacter sp. MWH-Berg-3C6]|uniref:A/G-specific adenine glycosylase n=1 Tax=Polynucleobacter sp. MWH-Berg-3C6 TaxID=1855882 RepID=UPI001C0C85CA|nr:A/G-specific adenine glycosylase [Polynucleobacter sp. MWH-Berg-3C6]MBU3551095.1 A/G-specific adenine glycosylase [Polynucleobacter sp. MWH-Berg-3C6]
MSKTLINTFSKKLLAWHGVSGRSGLPWQGNRDPYAVWVSEIMLQQTQVATVLGRYPLFMKRFPTVKKLAAADIDEVLAEWAGMGYYSRARNLHACAKQVMQDFSGKFPSDPILLEQLKGIGRSTAGAIAAFAFHERAPILDANVKRILARLFAIEGAIQDKAVNERLWQLAQNLLPNQSADMPVYTQALMDFGATWCTARKPVCMGAEKKCPFAKDCQANLSNQVLALPQKAIKAKSPEFDCDMLLIRSGNFVLLQKRPSKAIWGGLWSLPESPWRPRVGKGHQTTQGLKELLAIFLPEENIAGLGKSIKELKPSNQIKHIFTHRRLWMQIWEANTSKTIEFLSPNLKWVPLAQLGRYGLPQPIKILLLGLSLIRGGDLKN